MKLLITALFFLNLNIQAMEIYILDTQIGNTLFKDVLILDQDHGTLTVPGQFSTPIKNYKNSSSSIQFDIATIENGSPLNASYELSTQDQFQTLEGFLIIDQEKFLIKGERVYAK